MHPVEVESVAWITERRNVLSLALAIGSMVAYFRYIAHDARDQAYQASGGWIWFVLSLALFAAAVSGEDRRRDHACGFARDLLLETGAG